MRVLDLFSGIGGFSLGLERAGMTTVAFCEYEEFPRKVLAKHWPDVPCYPDVRTLTKEVLIADGIMADTNGEPERRQAEQADTSGNRGAAWMGASVSGGGRDVENTAHSVAGGQNESGAIDLICGGYPCQPFSTAGKRAGAEDDRHLWPEMYRLIETIRPRWVLAENVAGHISMGLDAVLSDLEAAHYTVWPFVIPACAVDARHRRDRVWIVANSMRGRKGHSEAINKPSLDEKRDTSPSGERWTPVAGEARRDDSLANAKRIRQPGSREHERSKCSAKDSVRKTSGAFFGGKGVSTKWLPEPSVGRVANGVPRRVDRLKALGNAVVPQVVEVIGRAIMRAA